MEQILITGENGYISNSLKRYFTTESVNKKIILKSIRKENLSFIELKGINVLIHPAAIVHRKESSLSKEIYFEVNTELTVELAKKAKEAGVQQFVFFSTMAVYGDVQGCIDEKSEVAPISLYGKSKLWAEIELMKLESANFKIAIIRPPMVYGFNCPGNYRILSKLTKKICFFPDIQNKRSMIFIDNLCEHVLQIINNKDSGIFHPQDERYVNTSYMVKKIAEISNRKLRINKLIGIFLGILIGHTNIYQKIFGDLYYASNLSNYNGNTYQKYDLSKAILITEKGYKDEKII